MKSLALLIQPELPEILLLHLVLGDVCAQSCLILCDPMDCSPPGSSVHGTPGKNTGTDCHFLLQGIFLTQGLNPGLADSLPLHHLERPPGTWGKGVKGILCFPPSFYTLSYTLK